jgi:hypothetical protein
LTASVSLSVPTDGEAVAGAAVLTDAHLRGR